MLEKQNIEYEKAILVGVISKHQNEVKVQEYLDELEFLTYTAGGEVIETFCAANGFAQPQNVYWQW